MKTVSWTLIPLVLVAAVLFLAPAAGFCEDNPRVFSNDDIDKYRNPSDSRPQEQRKTAPTTKKDENKKARESQEQEYWCKRASAANRKIESADRKVREIEADISREESKRIQDSYTSRTITGLQGRLKKAKDQQASAERDLTDIENEAHRKGIRPGWLRCQFD